MLGFVMYVMLELFTSELFMLALAKYVTLEWFMSELFMLGCVKYVMLEWFKLESVTEVIAGTPAGAVTF